MREASVAGGTAAPDGAKEAAGRAAWRRAASRPSLAEVYRSVPVSPTGSPWRKMVAFLGPGYLVAVGYMDPGNWA
ncbi:MAG: hypothetical protein F9K43_15520, partial [Bauldia sp.]